ncbi:MAG: HAMP domain-containing histidine kinase [Acutalibacter sp.]|nr:HAMP domain-containing histidine kinase [Acutalibacter sp.]
MATNSRNTNTFAGLLSWLCLLVALCGACCAVVFFTLVLANPHTLRFAAEHLQEIAGSAEGYLHSGPVMEEAQRQDLVYNYTVQIISALAILGTALALIFLFRQDRHAFEDLVAKGLGKIWVELKLGVLGLLFFLSLLIFLEGYGMKKAFALTVLCVLTVYLLCLDISRNRRFFGHNILHSFLVRLNRYETMSTFEQRALRRVYSVVGVIGGLVAIYIFSLFVFRYFVFYVQIAFAATSIVSVGIVGTVWWYILALKRDLRDWNLLMDQITEMYGGDLNAVNHVSPTSNLYDCAMQLNMIRTGVQKAVEEGTKADRTKIELITNVSHDIKTPLTSIISYVELLKKEPDLPPAAADYVNTIAQKAQRLSGIVQDVFEVSKAATGNISLNLEDLDLGRLMRQTLVEMEQTIQRSQLVWRVDIPEVPMVIHADGQRLYRVLQNLIRNCTQYSLEGSRVYVTLSAQNGQALVSIRNISKNEITMNGEDLTARFVRGDQNRTTEGSGLGLSIAKSFTEACGGSFFVRTDGDMFTVTVQFPLVALRPEAVPILQVESPPAAPEPLNLDAGTREGSLP